MGDLMDLLTNRKIDGGWSKCHSGLDFLLTPTGDIALTEDGRDNQMQRLARWVVTPKGELTDPLAGCSLYTGRHSKLIREELDFLAGDLLMDLRYSFPEWIIKRVRCAATYDLDGVINPNACACEITLADEVVDLLLSPDIPEELWLGARTFLTYNGRSGNING